VSEIVLTFLHVDMPEPAGREPAGLFWWIIEVAVFVSGLFGATDSRSKASKSVEEAEEAKGRRRTDGRNDKNCIQHLRLPVVARRPQPYQRREREMCQRTSD
jgi:hypothetical protein